MPISKTNFTSHETIVAGQCKFDMLIALDVIMHFMVSYQFRPQH